MVTACYRVANGDDLEEIVALVETCYRSAQSAETWTSEYRLVSGRRSSPDEIGQSIAGPGSVMIVGELDAAIVSCCRLTDARRGRVHLGLLCVRPDLQSQGLGSALLETAVAIAKDRFCARELSLQVLAPRVELRAWYERAGFQETGVRLAFSEQVDPTLALVEDLEFVVYARHLTGPSSGS